MYFFHFWVKISKIVTKNNTILSSSSIAYVREFPVGRDCATHLTAVSVGNSTTAPRVAADRCALAVCHTDTWVVSSVCLLTHGGARLAYGQTIDAAGVSSNKMTAIAQDPSVSDTGTIGVARGAVGAPAPPGWRKKNFRPNLQENA